MKKLLYQLDTDPQPSVFDNVVAYDGGADHVTAYANCHKDMITPLVEGAIFTRSGSNKKNTALFVGGSDITSGDTLFDAVRKHFFDSFRVSIMLDSNGCNTTAAAAVASILKSGDISGKNAVILAGTGPVGGRAAVIMAKLGANVSISSRGMERSQQACDYLKARFGVEIKPVEAKTNENRAELVENAHIVLATGAAGVPLLDENDWKDNRNMEVLVDANAVPPAGIKGVKMADKGESRHGKTTWGAIGFGPLKLGLQRKCIERLFEQNDLVLDVDDIFSMAREIV
ncbi:MAG: methylenetetrahydrofolate dehydrogenase [Gammaproteobacteria bacterium]|nr:methylenetetrahydrofolate dehydrogenase [Gammaproteobacteria bacterium]